MTLAGNTFLSIRDSAIGDDWFLSLQEIWILGCCSGSGPDIVKSRSTRASKSHDEDADVVNVGGQLLVVMDRDLYFVWSHTVEYMMEHAKKSTEWFGSASSPKQKRCMRPDVELLITAMRNGKVILAAVRCASDATSANARHASEGQRHSTAPCWTQVTLYPRGCNTADSINGNLCTLSEECYKFLRKLYGMAYLQSENLGQELVEVG